MDVQLLEDIGLTTVQAVAYKTLVESGPLSAPALASKTGESRTNGYKVLDRLVELGLVIRESRGGKFQYAAASPAALEQLVKQQAEAVHQKERRLNSELSHMLDYYFARTERPGIRYFQGKDGIASIHKDQLLTRKEICYIRTPSDVTLIDPDELHRMRNMYPKFGIHRRVIIPDSGPVRPLTPDNRMPVDESDRHMLLKRTWIHEQDYTAPVEWSVYGDKLSIVQYGEEAMGMIIESAPIAEAFRQLFGLLDEGIRRRPEYARMPLKTTHTAIPESAKKKTQDS
ncbi:MAG TPA: helix-turn-helix domain-containing protein [Candidatus Saccharimonadales bacterium]|nr:helix-turn-helix domain-containing protein [Candidatus Saccharimonadales bacterium]